MPARARPASAFLGALLTVSFFLPSSAAASRDQEKGAPQETPRPVSADLARGKQLLEQGDVKGAVKALRSATKKDKRDAEAWHYLGVAFAREGKGKDALKSLEKAVDLRLGAYGREFHEQVKDESALSQAEGDVRRARFSAKAREAVESLEKYIALNPRDAKAWRLQLEAIRPYAAFADDPRFTSIPFRLSGYVKRAAITNKPDPPFTEEARKNNVSGVVRLRALFGADGTVQNIVVVKSLPDGLTERCILAALQIKFKPATLAGRPISQLITLEYNFNIY